MSSVYPGEARHLLEWLESRWRAPAATPAGEPASPSPLDAATERLSDRDRELAGRAVEAFVAAGLEILRSNPPTAHASLREGLGVMLADRTVVSLSPAGAGDPEADDVVPITPGLIGHNAAGTTRNANALAVTGADAAGPPAAGPESPRASVIEPPESS